MNEQVVPTPAIEESLLKVRERIARLEKQRSDLDEQLAADREEEKIWCRLVALRGGESIAATPHQAASSTPFASHGNTKPKIDNPVVSAVVEELGAAGRPIHISELMRLVKVRQVPIPGAGTQANLIAHLSRDPRIVRPTRGMYALSEWGLAAMPAPRRHRRRRRRVRTQVSTRKDTSV